MEHATIECRFFGTFMAIFHIARWVGVFCASIRSTEFMQNPLFAMAINIRFISAQFADGIMVALSMQGIQMVEK